MVASVISDFAFFAVADLEERFVIGVAGCQSFYDYYQLLVWSFLPKSKERFLI